MEFIAKKKKVRVTIGDENAEMCFPSIGILEDFYESISKAEPRQAGKTYIDFLASLGLPETLSKKMDYDDLLDLIKFITVPKKKD